MEFLSPELAKGRGPEYEKLMENPDVVHNIHRDWLRRVDRGEATLNEDPFRLSAEQIDLRDKIQYYRRREDVDDEGEEDTPEVSLWDEEEGT